MSRSVWLQHIGVFFFFNNYKYFYLSIIQMDDFRFLPKEGFNMILLPKYDFLVLVGDLIRNILLQSVLIHSQTFL